MAADPNYFMNVPIFIIGFIIVTLNMSVISTICFFKKLRGRTELGILSALATADTLCGFGYMSNAIRTMIMGGDNTPYLPLRCMQVFGVHMYMIGPEFLTMLMVVLSIDRLISVASIQAYKQLGVLYLLVSTGVPFVAVASSYGSVWYLASSATAPVDNFCGVGSVGGRWWYLYHNCIQLICPATSVIVYICVLVMLHRQRSRLTAKIIPMDPNQRRQLRMTINVGFMVVCTLVLYVVPSVGLIYLGYFFTGSATLLSSAQIACRVITSAYSCINIITFLARPSDVKSHMKILWEQIRQNQREVKPVREQRSVPKTTKIEPRNSVPTVPLLEPEVKLLNVNLLSVTRDSVSSGARTMSISHS